MKWGRPHSSFWSPRRAESRAPKRPVERRARPRPQRVRFRRRYASSLARQLTSYFWTSVQVVFVGAILVWGGFSLLHFWRSSPILKISRVTFEGDIPERLKSEANRLVSKNILSLRPSLLESEYRQKFTELKELSIQRHWDRAVTIKGIFRRPVAFVNQEGRRLGVDAEGRLFPVIHASFSDLSRPLLSAPDHDMTLRDLVDCLNFIEQKAPAFHRRIEKIESDRMKNVTFSLAGGVVVHWTDLNEDEIVEAAENILRLTSAFVPKTSPASLKVVSPDRLVMDDHWQPRPDQDKQGGSLVKS